MWRRQLDWPIGWQLTIFYTALLVIILGFLGLLLYRQLSHFLLEDTESRLVREVDLILYHDGSVRRWSPAGRGEAPVDGGTDQSLWQLGDDLIQLIGGRGTHVGVYDGMGHMVREGEAPPDMGPWPEPPPDAMAAALAGRATFSIVPSKGPRLLMLVDPIQADGTPIGAAVVSTSLEGEDAVLEWLRRYVLAGAGLGVLIGAVVGVRLTRHVLDPLDRVATTAEAVAAGDRSRRVGLAGRRNEIGRVAIAFDHMVDQLQTTLDAQRRFVADASHELRTPLTSLHGMVEMLLLGVDADDVVARQRLLRQLEGELARMNRLVSDLLMLTRLDAAPPIQMRAVDLTALACEVGDLLRSAWPDRMIDLPSGPSLLVMGDADRLRQVLINLTDNAAKYTAPGDHISIAIRRDGEWVDLTVTDTGAGMSADILPHVFDRFFRANRSRTRRDGGAGLGLAITRAIVEIHGGAISAMSDGPGCGSAFRVRLRAVSATAGARGRSLRLAGGRGSTRPVETDVGHESEGQRPADVRPTPHAAIAGLSEASYDLDPGIAPQAATDG
jgi:two-component system OmpR family sensor kinase